MSGSNESAGPQRAVLVANQGNRSVLSLLLKDMDGEGRGEMTHRLVDSTVYNVAASSKASSWAREHALFFLDMGFACLANILCGPRR